MLPIIRADDPPDVFPPVETALRTPNGLLAAGGDLQMARLLAAYQRGIFPWYGEEEPVLWWSPDPRCVFHVGHLHIARRLGRTLRQGNYEISFNREFEQVIHACAEPRRADTGSWLLPEMQAAYIRLHRSGHAHSVEVWQQGALIGGLYGISVGKVFSAESMFSRVSDASKIALVALDQQLQSSGYLLIDAQVGSSHLYRMGARDMPRYDYLRYLSAD